MNAENVTNVVGIFGYPVKHTLSPAMHEAAFRALRLNFVYLPFEVAPEGLKAAVNAVRSLNMRGVNLTIPHKEKALRHVDALDRSARKTGSINVIVNRKGRLTGYNTDGAGFLADIREQGISPGKKTVLILGAGGAALAVATALSGAGDQKIFVAARNRKRASALVRDIARTKFVPLEAAGETAAAADMVVNATPVGMNPADPPLLLAETLRKDVFVYDIVYTCRTALLREAEKAGAPNSGGLGMLLYQGAAAFELWTEEKAPVAAMRQALVKALESRQKKTNSFHGNRR